MWIPGTEILVLLGMESVTVYRELVDIEGGELYETQILGIEKGQTGKPGSHMSGVIYYGKGTKLGK